MSDIQIFLKEFAVFIPIPSVSFFASHSYSQSFDFGSICYLDIYITYICVYICSLIGTFLCLFAP